eukprot:1548821-Amphidinium_carterae.2
MLILLTSGELWGGGGGRIFGSEASFLSENAQLLSRGKVLTFVRWNRAVTLDQLLHHSASDSEAQGTMQHWFVRMHWGLSGLISVLMMHQPSNNCCQVPLQQDMPQVLHQQHCSTHI